MRFAPPSPTPPGLARRVPPAIFPPIMGLFGLGLAWRRFGVLADLPVAAGEVILGGVTLLFLFALGAYGLKLARRPKVLVTDLAVLPGRLGVSALFANLYLLAAVLAPYAPALAPALILAALALHLGLMVVIARSVRAMPEGARLIYAGGHLYFSSLLVAALAGAVAGQAQVAGPLLVASTAVAAAIVLADLVTLARGHRPPPPLRPLLALHLSVVSVAGLAGALMGWTAFAQTLAILSGLTLLGLVLSARWLTVAGFSALWSAFTFPIAATASFWLSLGGVWLWPGQGVLLAATGIVPAIAFRVLKLWAGGQLAVKTNAASA